MAFSIYASTNNVTTQLNTGNPFRFDSIDGLSGATVTRLQQRGALQDGVTDLGYRLQPRVVKLSLLFNASSAALLDGYRDQLGQAFPVLSNTTTFLSTQRDDNAIRTLRCHRVGEIEISLVPEQRAAKLHRATVYLRAASPAWQKNEPTIASTPITAWYLAGGAIGTAQVRAHAENPSQGQVFSGGVTENTTGDWAVAVTTSAHVEPTTAYAWDDHPSAAKFWKNIGIAFEMNDAGAAPGAQNGWPGGTAAPPNYHVVASRSAVNYWYYLSGTAIATHHSGGGDVSLGNNNGLIWRAVAPAGFTGGWTPAISRGMAWKDPTDTQILALASYMSTASIYGVTAINAGELPAYPVIQLTGPLTNPILTNTATGRSINLTGLTLGTAETCMIDLRTGDKKITNAAGSSLLGNITTLPAALADFHIAPAPLAPGGINVISIAAGSIGVAAVASIQHTDLYTSF